MRAFIWQCHLVQPSFLESPHTYATHIYLCYYFFFLFCSSSLPFSFFFFLKFYLFIYSFMVVLGPRFCARALPSCGKRGPLFIAVRGPLTIAASLVAEHRPRRAGSAVVVHGPSCSAACGIFPDQGSNPCPLHWQADSQPLCHQGSPPSFYIYFCNEISHPLIHFLPVP